MPTYHHNATTYFEADASSQSIANPLSFDLRLTIACGSLCSIVA